MWRKAGEILLVCVLWVAVAAYIGYAAWLTRRHRATRTVEHVEVRIVDSTANDRLVTSKRVREWLMQSGIPTIGVAMADADVARVRDMILENHFVEDVDVYVTYNGVMHIDVDQRCPVMRLVVDGYNSYLTSDGFMFAAPEESALYVPAVSGSYRPLVPPGFEGYVSVYRDTLLRRSDRRLQALVREELRLRDSDRVEVRNINRMRVKRFRRKWPLVEREERYAERKAAFVAGRDKYVEEHRALRRALAAGMESRERREREEYAFRKMSLEKYDDLRKLTTFVEWISADPFWSGEIVQTVAYYTPSGELAATLIPRSGDFRIEFGPVEEPAQRFGRLMLFYRKGLGTAGWDRYEIIDVRYNNQVVCTKR